MTKVIAAAAGLAVAGAASAQLQVFSVLAVNSGDVTGAIPNAGLSIDAPFNQVAPPFGSNLISGVSDFIDFEPALEFDSYVAVGGEPITSGASNAGPVIDTVEFSFDSQSLTGAWFVRPDQSDVEPSNAVGGEFDVFLGRFVGGSLSGELVIGGLNEGGDDLGQFALNLDGTPGTPSDGIGQAYFLRVDVSSGPAGQVNDVYLEAVPAPGAAGLLGFAGLAAARRRR